MRARVIISGIVQGVGFRVNTYQKLRELGLGGNVWNRPDGKVEGVFQGEKRSIDEMIQWCHAGPPSAYVTGVDVRMEEEVES